MPAARRAISCNLIAISCHKFNALACKRLVSHVTGDAFPTLFWIGGSWNTFEQAYVWTDTEPQKPLRPRIISKASWRNVSHECSNKGKNFRMHTTLNTETTKECLALDITTMTYQPRNCQVPLPTLCEKQRSSWKCLPGERDLMRGDELTGVATGFHME